MRAMRSCTLAALAVCCLVGTPPSLHADSEKAMVARLQPQYRDWWLEVSLLIGRDERKEFLGLTKDYERDLFIRRFWEARNPDPGIAPNAFKIEWERRIEAARDYFGNITEDRAVTLLLHSAPPDRIQTDCLQATWPLEIWHYRFGERIPDDLYLLFYQTAGSGPFRLWRQGDGLATLIARLSNQRSPQLPSQGGVGQGSRPPDINFSGLGAMSNDLSTFWTFLQANCPDEAPMLMNAVTTVEREDSFHILDKLLVPPPPHDAEWLATFRGYSTNVPPGSLALPATLKVTFPARQKSRAVVSGTVAVPPGAAQAVELEGHRAYNFLLTGEVVQGTELVESFRYRFDMPAPSGAQDTPLPLVFERTLAPGDYVLLLRVEDLHSHHNFHAQEPITVPPLDGLPDVATAARPPEVTAVLDAARAELKAGDAGAAPPAAPGAAGAPATAAGGGAGAAIRLVPPEGERITGAVRLEAQASGDAVRKVTFYLDGKAMLSRVRPPYSVELNLGDVPLTHEVRAVAYARDGAELSADTVMLNVPRQRFAVHLVEPRAGGTYKGQVLARAEVHLPDGGKLDRLEVFVDDQRVATLYQPPFAQQVTLKADNASYVRAVGYLTDGTSAEDLAVINSRNAVESLDVRLVELYAAVVDRAGHPVDRLQQSDFKVTDGGEAQTLLRCERVRDLPLHVLFALDTSASMTAILPQVQRAALAFLQRTLTPKDRAALLTFSDSPILRVPFTANVDTLAGALAGLSAERGTALFDSLVYGLSYMKGAQHTQSALVLFTDGDDHLSHLRFEETLEYARRSGIALYTIGAGVSRLDLQSRAHLSRLAEETGGRSYFIDSAAQLDSVYDAIGTELRSRYLLAYQPNKPPHIGEFRSVDVQVLGDGLRVKTQRGYYP